MTTSLFQASPVATTKFVRFATRVVTDGVLNSSTTVTSATANFTTADVGAAITATGIPAADTIATRSSATSILLASAATASASGVTLTITQTTANAVASFNTELQAAFTSAGIQCLTDTVTTTNALLVIVGSPSRSVPPGSWVSVINGQLAVYADSAMHGAAGAPFTDYFLT